MHSKWLFLVCSNQFFVHFSSPQIVAPFYLSLLHTLISFYQLLAQHKIASDLNFCFIYHLPSNNLLVSILPIWWIDTIENWKTKERWKKKTTSAKTERKKKQQICMTANWILCWITWGAGCWYSCSFWRRRRKKKIYKIK